MPQTVHSCIVADLVSHVVFQSDVQQKRARHDEGAGDHDGKRSGTLPRRTSSNTATNCMTKSTSQKPIREPVALPPERQHGCRADRVADHVSGQHSSQIKDVHRSPASRRIRVACRLHGARRHGDCPKRIPIWADFRSALLFFGLANCFPGVYGDPLQFTAYYDARDLSGTASPLAFPSRREQNTQSPCTSKHPPWS